MNKIDEERLVHDAIAGHPTALLSLYQSLLPMLRGVVARSLHNRDDTDDVLQEIWLEAARSIHSFTFRSAFSTWLVSIALRVAFAMNRRSQKLRTLRSPARCCIGDPTASLLLAIDLDRALTRLPPSYRNTLVSHDIEGYKHREIASRFHISSGASKSLLRRARLACRNELSIDGGCVVA